MIVPATTPSYPHVDDGLAADVLAVLGTGRDAGVEAITTAFRAWLPAGSAAKRRAVEADRIPPGADPAEALEERLGGSVVSWSCWPICTSLGAVLASCGHDVALVAEHRRQGGAVPVVDFHSVLLVDGDLVDPYLGPGAPVPLGHDVSRPDAWAAYVPGVRPDHLGVQGGGRLFRYRELARALDRRDVLAFCDVSAVRSGVGHRRTAHWVRDGATHTVRETDDGTAEFRVSAGADPFGQHRRLVATGDFDDLVSRIVDGSEVAGERGRARSVH